MKIATNEDFDWVISLIVVHVFPCFLHKKPELAGIFYSILFPLIFALVEIYAFFSNQRSVFA